jgi:hypothetical protein
MTPAGIPQQPMSCHCEGENQSDICASIALPFALSLPKASIDGNGTEPGGGRFDFCPPAISHGGGIATPGTRMTRRAVIDYETPQRPKWKWNWLAISYLLTLLSLVLAFLAALTAILGTDSHETMVERFRVLSILASLASAGAIYSGFVSVVKKPVGPAWLALVLSLSLFSLECLILRPFW